MDCRAAAGNRYNPNRQAHMPSLALMDPDAAAQATTKALAMMAQQLQAGTLSAAVVALAIPEPEPNQFWRVNGRAIVFWRYFVAAGGLVLNPDQWEVDKGAAKAVAAAVERGLRAGTGGIRAANAFIHEDGACWNWLKVDVNDWIGDDETGQEFGDLLNDLFTREINRAHTAANALAG